MTGPSPERVCVVGGGPGGLALALALLQRGIAVTVLEQHAGRDRAYRGEILQPGGLEVLDRLGVVDAALSGEHHVLPRFTLVENGRPALDIDYGVLPGPHNHLVSLPQRLLLSALREACARLPGFDYREGVRARALLHDGDGRVCGVLGRTRAGEITVPAACVVGADGRYSTIRTLAGIPNGRVDVFDQDVLWCRLHAPGRPVGRVAVHQAAHRPVLLYDSGPDGVQIGWMLAHGGYREAIGRGAGWIADELCAALPRYADLIAAQVRTPSDLTLLDVFAGCAPRWTADGLVLIGDAAHTHSPLGAQGINLALQDALALAPVLDDALARDDLSAATLGAFERARRPAVHAVMRFQVRQSRALLSRNPVVRRVRPRMARLVSAGPLARPLTRFVAHGPSPRRSAA